MSYSPVPGMYVVYDYSNAQHVGNVTFPGKFAITEAGRTVVEAQVVSLTQPEKAGAAIYTPPGLSALGVGFPLTPPWSMQDIEFSGRRSGEVTEGQFVVVRGMVAPDGSMSEAEVLASSSPGLNQRALERAAQRHRTMPQDDANGATPQAHEAFLVTLFVTN